MDLDSRKHLCGICKDWKGKRKLVEGMIRVKSSTRGLCKRLQKSKPPQGGCDQWEKWNGKDDAEIINLAGSIARLSS